ncbi:MAG: glutaconate CoA-transferase, subunit [Solirubrobacteraceae bacterium]|jgi:glutaconate CoA-transferase subunit B|nr:glutaconate CoA-transferase, subunit [Solirubrobacteraceae bacterium]
MSENGYDAQELMTINAARELRDGLVCLVGVGPPNAAANLARRTHAPNTVLVYESGAIGAKPRRLPLSIGDDDLAETADELVSVPEMFNYWVGGGRIDVGFLGAAQIDRVGNINTTVIGDYAKPKVRLPGAGGAPEIAARAREVIVLVRHSPRVFVEKIDFITSIGPGGGPIVVITDLGVLRPSSEGDELILTAVHHGVEAEQVKQATGWDLTVAEDLQRTPPPSDEELETLRDLRASAERAPGPA